MDEPFAFDSICLPLLEPHDASLLQFSIVDDMVCLWRSCQRRWKVLGVTVTVLTCGQHALDKVVDITQNDAITLSVALTLGAKRLDLNALQDWHRVFPLDLLFVMEDGTVLRQSRAS
jgi:hypothetical protein